ncbi:MAG: WbqC family protein [Flavobacteriales bacterium]
MVILPSCPFPSIYWLSLAANQEEVKVDVLENYPKQTYRNRYDILGPNGRQTLTIPVNRPSGVKTPISEIQIAYGSWVNEHLGAIRSAYGKSAFFDHFFYEIEALYQSKPQLLIDFNSQSLNIVKRVILPETKLSVIEENVAFSASDLRLNFEPAFLVSDFKSYPQVFSDRFEFQNNLSVLDLVFNMGPRGKEYIDY